MIRARSEGLTARLRASCPRADRITASWRWLGKPRGLRRGRPGERIRCTRCSRSSPRPRPRCGSRHRSRGASRPAAEP